jgi:hypothetical protein
MKEKIEEYEKKVKELDKTYNLSPVVTIEFPQYRVLPDEVQLALKVLERHEYKFMLSYKENI